MRRICAWCKKEYGTAESDRVGDITHGICSLCALELTKDTLRNAKKIIGFISEPVFVLNGDGVLKAANSSAIRMLNKHVSEIEDSLGGDAFECTYSKRAEGCGRSIHCKTCAIRNIVMDTLISGVSRTAVPAFQSIDTPDGPKVLRFTISTERIGEMILLRIDEVLPNPSL